MTERTITVGVVGLGSLGLACAELLHEAGIPVIAVDPDPAALAQGSARALPVSAEFAALSTADLVIESVTEDKEIKGAVLRAVAAVCAPDTVLVSTTASLSLPSLAIASGRPTRLLGLRFLVPPVPGTGCEPVPTTMSDQDAVDTLTLLLDRLPLQEKTFGPARQFARELLLGYLNRAVTLYETGYATPEDIDTAMRLGCGLPTGPLALLDRLGLDVVERELSGLYERSGRAAHAPAPLLTALVESGRSGRKTGTGIYDYEPSGAVIPSRRTDPAEETAPREVRRIGVVGSGTMARGIAQITALGGLDTILVARTREKAETAIEAIDSAMARAVRRGQIHPDQRQAALARLHPSSVFEDLADRDVVLEAVAEDEDVKAHVFGLLDRTCRPGAILTTTTSSLSVGNCAEATGRRGDVVGMHFFNPAPAMSLVEVCRTEFTTNDVLATAHALARSLGKTPVDCTDRAGFIVNYLLFPYLNDAVLLAESGAASIEDLDKAVEGGLGHPLGPFALMDAIGLDVGEAIQQRLHDVNHDPDVKPTAMLTALIRYGRLGRKTGAGFYNHVERAGRATTSG
ncbi:3-hydroxyacyl-CoA dehydrogenase family protein [Streptomyces sp. NBC_00878]|uniref:3-hydroxyacyl-CoA dehydrogenase family protein n=1 Tax=Streptomyces sp. NBC_00878 TaxID=2975854 RepID=UPI00224CDD37|nr:3-hydroxyacyl-CoA dehydrogenase family protein [Streptomyces sp. NBC_00878]MCX4911440.1 3-hydroxyacyl-CoA dehydrogenase family protein [Streptomyces sp. NBC_00878]